MRLMDIGRAASLAALCLSVLAGPARGQTIETVDVLGVYPDHTAALVADPEAMFVRNIEYANRALENSNVRYRYNLVHVEQINWGADGELGGTQLRSLAEDSRVQALRTQYGADIVAGIVPSRSGLCGIGYVPSATDDRTLSGFSRNYAYSLSGHDCGGRTMAHEIGHNAGLGHSAAQGSRGAFGAYARGHGVDGSFVTIMAYNSAYGVFSSAGRVQVHSNPDIDICRDQPCGVPRGRSNEADAAQALDIAGPQLADYNDSVVTPQNRPPQARDDSTSTDQGRPVTLDVLVNDSDPDADALVLESVTAPSHGTARITSASGAVRYEPDPGFVGEDRFDYTIRDARGATDSATVTVDVRRTTSAVNLAVNGDAESGLDGWAGVWGARLRTVSPGISGNASVAGSAGFSVTDALAVPFAGGQRYAFSASLRADRVDRALVFLRLRQDGRWRWRFVTGVDLPADEVVELTGVVDVPAGEVQEGFITFFFPRRIQGEVLIDDVRLGEP